MIEQQTRTERQRIAKKVVVDLIHSMYEVTSVRLGRGTAHSWIYIRTKHYVPHDVRSLIEHHLGKHVQVGKFSDDFGGDESCVSWSVS
jgi:hypothetical protein